jgi:uncharacterized membrane protein YedE/YeeE
MVTIASHQDVVSGLKGGALIGASASLLLAVVGRISGMSGIVTSALKGEISTGSKWDGFADSSSNSVFYVGGLLTAGWIHATYSPKVFGDQSNVPYHLSMTGIALAAALTAFGVRFGNGCTSGHGVCGLPRRSMRSIVAVSTFMTTGAITTYVMRTKGSEWPLNLLTSPSAEATEVAITTLFNDGNGNNRAYLFITGSAVIAHLLFKYGARESGKPSTATQQGLRQLLREKQEAAVSLPYVVAANATSFFAATLFGFALGMSGMTDMGRVYNFLDFSNAQTGWDPSLAGVMGGAVAVNAVIFEVFNRLKMVPVLKRLKLLADSGKKNDDDALPSQESCGLHNIIDVGHNITTELVAGAALFGMGWGLGGVCPGPAMVSLFNPASSYARFFVPVMFVSLAAQAVGKRVYDDYVRARGASSKEEQDMEKFSKHNARIETEVKEKKRRDSRKGVSSTKNAYDALHEDSD